MATGKSYTWKGADGGSWAIDSNWDDGNVPSTGYPGETDFAQFIAFSGTVTGSVSADVLDIGPGSALTFDGSGFFTNINVGQDLNFDVGGSSLTIASGQVISATTLQLGSYFGSTGTLIADGQFATTGGIIMDQGGEADSIIVHNGGEVDDGVSLTMAAGGLIQIDSSGKMIIGSSDGTSGALTIDNSLVFSGEGTIQANVVVNGTLETFNAGWPANKLIVTGNITGTGSVSVVQELDVGGAIGSGVMISLFSNGGANAGLLRLADPTENSGTFVTMSSGSVIVLTGLSYDNVFWDSDGLHLTGTSAPLTLKTLGDHSFQIFSVKQDGSDTDIVVSVACFCSGTLISTERGQVAVETLKRGDLVLTTKGQLVPVSWVGRQTVSTRFSDPLRVLPIRIKANALANGLPSRDLLLSPDHAIVVGDILVQAGALVNSTSIMRETNVPQTFTYFHVELDDHSLILAENTPAETFIDNVDRLAFDNWAEHESLYPDGKAIVEMPYPRAKAHRQVPRAIRKQLAERAAILICEAQEVAV